MRPPQDNNLFSITSLVAALSIWTFCWSLVGQDNTTDIRNDHIPDKSVTAIVNSLANSIWRSTLSSSYANEGSAALKQIRKIDGHATILALQFEQNRRKSVDDIIRIRFFRTLSKIDTANSIEVLIGYLDDFSDAPSKAEIESFTDVSPTSSNAVLAAGALDEMGLDGAPLDKHRGGYTDTSIHEDSEVWKKWWGLSKMNFIEQSVPR